MNKWLIGIVCLLFANFSFGGDVKPEVETSPGFYRVIKSGDVLVNADGIPYTVFNVTNIPPYYVTNNSYGINFGSLTVQGHPVITNETYGKWASNQVYSLPTNKWNWVVIDWSNSVARSIVSFDTQRWNQAYNTAIWASNNVGGSAPSSYLYVSNSAVWASNGVLILNGLTTGWNQAAMNATWSSNGVITLNGLTSGWNQAHSIAIWASNTAFAVSNYAISASYVTNYGTNISITATWASNSVVILNGLTTGWNQASIDATWATNSIIIISGSLNDATSRISILEAQTSNWNTVSGISNIATWSSNQVIELWAQVYYSLPTVSFSSPIGGYYEIGSSVTNIDLSFTVNKNMLTRNYSNGYVQSLGAGGSYTTNLLTTNSSSITYTITVSDIKTNYASSSQTLTFTNRKYYGLSVNDTNALFNSEILSFTTTWESKGNSGTVSPSSQYIYVIYPSSLGLCTSFTLGGFGTSAWPHDTRNVTNSSGYVESFFVYRTNNKLTAGSISYDIH